MKTVIIDGIKFQTTSDKEVKGRLTYDIKIISLGYEGPDTKYLVWSNIPNFELQGVIMPYMEFSAYATILTSFNYVCLQDLSLTKGNPASNTYVKILRYARIQNP